MYQKHVLFSFILFLSVHFAWSQADCSSAVVVCGNTANYNPSGVGAELEQLACGGIEHNSVWFAFQAQANGTLNFVIRPMTIAGVPAVVDFDWSLYALPGAPSSTNCDAKTQLSCNFAGTATVFGIPGATGLATPNYSATQFNPGIAVTAGSWYLLMVDQFSNTTPQIFNVQFTGNPEFAGLNSSPGVFNDQPNFTFAPANCTGLFNFTNTSASVGVGMSYLWDFGDGSTSTAQNPSKQYLTAGVYYVKLRVTNSNGCSSYITKKVQYNNGALTMATAGIFVTPSCTDSNSGTLTVNSIGTTTLGVSGGTEPYSYSLVAPSPVLAPNQSSPNFSGLPAGSYTVRATDYCGASATATISVTQIATNSTIGLGIQNVQASCLGSATGAAVINVNGSCPPYTISLVESSPVTSPVQNALQRDGITATYYGIFTNLLPGLYTVEATDACGKVRRATFTVGVSSAPSVGLVNSASCSNIPTGTITVTSTAATGLSANGSPGDFQYALIAPSPMLRPFQNSSVFENLAPGLYTVAVKDACGNIGTGTTTIGTAGNPTLGTSFTTPTCPNGSTGTIEAQLTGAGGGSPYTFQLVAPSPYLAAGQTSNAFTGLPAGTYTIKLTDVCGSFVTTTSTVNAASAPSFTTSNVSSCANSSNGSITVAPSATSIGPFSFELISPGAAIRPAQGSNVANSFSSIFTQLNQGNYTVKMTDGCGVPVTAAATITSPSALTFPAGSTTVPSCSSSSTGRIVVALPTTGVAPYTYSIISPSPITVSSQNSRIFDNLPVGSYTVLITDACGVAVSNGAAISIAAATAPTLTVTNTNSCATASGTITCAIPTTNQGGGTYNFSLIAPSPTTRPNQVSPIFTQLPAGVYTVQITDQCGVTGTTTTTIAAAGAFTPAAGGAIVDCNGSGGYLGQIIVTTPQNFTPGGPIPAGSGGGPYTYSIYDATNNTLIAPAQSTNMFIVAPVAGTPTHTIRVTDACGNTSTTTVTINPPVALTSGTITATTLSCSGTNTGVIKVTTAATGGLAPYSYTLVSVATGLPVLGPQTSTTFNNVPASATGYYIRSTDACGNTITSTTPLLFAPAGNPTVTATTVASCVSTPTGKVIATPGTGANATSGSFTFYLYDSGNTTLIAGPTSIGFFGSLAPGTYTVRIVDQCGSIGTVAATVTSTVTALTASGTATNSCGNGSTGVISAAYTGGSLPIQYALLDATGTTVVAANQSSNIFEGLAPATYIVRATDACGTTANSAGVTVGTSTLTPTITTSLAVFCGQDAIIGAFGSGGNGGPFTYALCSGAGCTTFSNFTTSSTFSISSSGTYRIQALDRCGNAITSGDIVVTIPIQAVVNSVTPASACGASAISVSYTNVSATPYYSIDGANFSSTLPTTVAVGNHTILVADYNAGSFSCASNAYAFTISSGLNYYADSDGDGYGAGTATASCTQPSGYVLNNTDCNDNSSSTNPAGIEICGNGIDEDCSGADLVCAVPGCTDVAACNYNANATVSNGSCTYASTWYLDADADGYYLSTSVSCASPGTTYNTTGGISGDCNDANAAVNAGATEVCNSIDDDCDTQIDEGLTFTNYYLDNDGDTFGMGVSSIPNMINENFDDVNIPLSGGWSTNNLSNPIGIQPYFQGNTSVFSSYNGASNSYIGVNFNSGSGTSNISNWLFTPEVQLVNGAQFTFYARTTDMVAYADRLQLRLSTNGASINVGTTDASVGDFTTVLVDINPNLTLSGFPNVWTQYTVTISGIPNGSTGRFAFRYFVTNAGPLGLNSDYVGIDNVNYTTPSITVSTCNGAPAGFVANNTDCNDYAPTVYPGATELCNNIDENCDTQIDEGVQNNYYVDTDGDGYGAGAATAACTAPTGYVTTNTDCDNTNAAVNPGATEVCNSIDDDCDTQIDEGLTFTNYYADVDGDGYGAGTATNACAQPVGFVTTNTDCNNTNSAINPAATEVCNSIDDDCDTQIDEGVQNNYYVDTDGDGYGEGTATAACTAPTGYVITSTDCDNTNAAVNPGATEVCNSIDDDCDTQIDEGLTFTNYYADEDGDGYGAGTATNACAQPVGFVTTNTDCNNNNAAVNPAATEVCNSIDDDCDTQIDEGVLISYYSDSDGDGYGAGAATNACAQPVGFVTTNTDCNDNSSAVNPNATETCNLIDDDCDGIIDDGVPVINYYSDLDGDTFGGTLVTSTCAILTGNFVVVGGDCDDANIAVNPGAVEICLNSIDDDCDGLVNDGCLPDQLAGESPATAQYVWTNFFPTCVTQSHTLSGSAPSLSSQSICLTGEDKWHYFTATSEAVSIVVASSANDILLELQNASGTLVATENAVSGLGGEILNFSGLVSGQVYKVGVRNYNSALGIGAYTLCVKMLKRGGCDYGPGPYNLCQYFKATFAGTGAVYTFTFTGLTGNAAGNVYTRTQSSDICVLSNVSPSLPYGSTYSVLITSTYNLQDAAGNTEIIAVPALSPCTMSTVTQPTTSLRTSDQCVNGAKFRGAIVASLPWVCGVTNWRWEFTEVNPLTLTTVGLPIVLNRGAASNYINLGTVSALQNGKTYAVRTAPILANTGSNYQWGPTYYMCIIGSAGMVLEDNNATSQNIKTDVVNQVNLSLYPNPTHGTDVNINLSGVESDNVQIRIVDAMGRQVWSNRFVVSGVLNTNITFEQPLANGLYFVEVIFNGEVQTQRLMVQK